MLFKSVVVPSGLAAGGRARVHVPLPTPGDPPGTRLLTTPRLVALFEYNLASGPLSWPVWPSTPASEANHNALPSSPPLLPAAANPTRLFQAMCSSPNDITAVASALLVVTSNSCRRLSVVSYSISALLLAFRTTNASSPYLSPDGAAIFRRISPLAVQKWRQHVAQQSACVFRPLPPIHPHPWGLATRANPSRPGSLQLSRSS